MFPAAQPEAYPVCLVEETKGIESPAIRSMFDYWQSRCGNGRIPARSEIDPADILPLLPNILMVEFETCPFRVRFRLVGTKVVEVTGFEFTGRYLDEIAAEEDAAPFAECYEVACRRQLPVARRITWRFDRKTTGDYDFAVFPLESDGSFASQAIAVECYVRLQKQFT
jgi:hypothetical protein